MSKRMDMWLLAVLLAGVSTQAMAEMDCGMPIQKIGRDTGSNPVVSVQVGRDPNGAWHVNHKLADGTIIYREQQYDMIDISDNDTWQWQGANRRNPWMWMRGETKTVNGRPGYVESLYDAHQGNRLVMYSQVQCLDPTDPRKYAPRAAPKPPVYEASVPPAQTYNPSTSTGLVVPIADDGLGGHTVDVYLGDRLVTMTLDTGASMVSIPSNIAYSLLSAGGGSIIGMVNSTIADGSVHQEPEINIYKVTIGGRTLENVHATIAPDNAMMLLGTNVLNRFGKYSIDTTNNQLILG
jgi:predicted aspartyl protease